ncbi:MAG: leucine-rich repeat protein [Oscillospiraceae bacterium]
MKKKFKLKALSILMAILMVATIIPMGAISSFALTSGDYEYSVISGTKKTVSIDKYTGTGGDVTIPSTIDGYTVTQMGDFSFKGCTSLTSVIIPNSVTTIGGGAFYGCTGLKDITMANGITNIGYRAFLGCKGLKGLTIPDSVTGIGDGAFDNCTSLTAINISEGNTKYSSIDGILYNKDKTEMFKCPQGKSGEIAISDSVTSIGNYAFSDCTGITNITISNSVTSIGYGAFDNTPFYNSLPDGEVYLGKVFYKYKGTIPKDTEITIKAGTVSISGTAFNGCTGLKGVTIPDSVTIIGYRAFFDCAYLTTVTIGNSVTSIGSSAFESCTSLKDITIPDSVTSIESSAFENTPFFVSMPDGEVYLGKVLYAYKGKMPKNTEINIKAGTTSITGYAFYYCTGLKGITIVDSVTSIGNYAFYGCTGLKSVTISDSVTSIGHNAFDETPFYNSLPDGEVYLGKVFYEYKGTMPADTEINIKPGTISITEYAFIDCAGLKGVTIPDSVTSIGDMAFGYYLNDNGGYEKLLGFTITGSKGSAAEKYAQDNNFIFVDITPPAPTRMLGDVTGDGRVTSGDAIAVLRAEAQLRTLTAEEFTAADVVKDGRVTSGDAIRILRYEAQLVPSL